MQTELAPESELHQPQTNKWSNLVRWAVAGLVAGLALAALMLGLQLLTGVPSLPELAQDRLLALLPGPLFGLLIDRLQFLGKPLLLSGWMAGQTILAGLLGAAYGRLVDPPNAKPALASGRGLVVGGVGLGLLFWAAAELVLLPLLSLGFLGTVAAEGMTSAAWSILAFAGYGLVFAGFYSLLVPGQAGPVAEQAARGRERNRRRLLALTLSGGLAMLSGLALWRVIDQIGERGTPAGASSTSSARGGAAGSDTQAAAVPAQTSGGATTAFEAPPNISAALTPTDKFYVVSKNFVDPSVNAKNWSLDVKGLVNTPRRFSYGDLQALPSSELILTLECISNLVGGDLISNTRWTGVPMSALLDRVGVKKGAEWVVFATADRYVESMPLDVARQPTTLLVHSMDGAPIPQKHGFPLRIIREGRYGMKNPKWVTGIELATSQGTGYWEEQGWNAENGIQTMARFDTRPKQASAGSSVVLGGVAFAGDRGISRVEVSTNGGEQWAPAAMDAPLSRFAWLRWSYRWNVENRGRATLMVRAIDGMGAVQTGRVADSYPSGATGYHTIQVQAS